MHVKIGDCEFETKKAAIKLASAILNRYELRERVSDPEDAAFVRELFLCHPKWEAKLAGRTISHFEVHPFTGGSRCFFVVRDDGTWEDFSLKKCIEAVAPSRRR